MGRPIELIAEFTKASRSVIIVNIADAAARGGAVFGIHFGENGSVIGYDTDGSGRINSVDAPSAIFNQGGLAVQLAFDDRKLPPLDFSTPSLPIQYLEILQGVGGGDNSDSGTLIFDSDTILGTDGNDTLTGTAAADSIVGLAGNDTINGLAENDTIKGGSGTDTIDGGAGDDTLNGGVDNDVISGNSGNDTIDGGAADDTLKGGTGTDKVDYFDDAAGVTVNLASNTATDGNNDTDTLSGIENATGSSSNDSLTGDTSANTLDGGAGNDTLTGGSGDDTLTGGTGTDTVDYSDDAAGVTVNLAGNTATDGNNDTDTLSGIENATGSNSNDSLTGDTSANSLDGGAGNDTLDDGAGGTDTLTGGTGDDTFVVHDGSGDVTITDFTPGSSTDDAIDLSDVASLTQFSDIDGATTDVGGNAVIDLGGGSTLTLTGVVKADLDSEDFTF